MGPFLLSGRNFGLGNGVDACFGGYLDDEGVVPGVLLELSEFAKLISPGLRSMSTCDDGRLRVYLENRGRGDESDSISSLMVLSLTSDMPA